MNRALAWFFLIGLLVVSQKALGGSDAGVRSQDASASLRPGDAEVIQDLELLEHLGECQNLELLREVPPAATHRP